jgi:GNAT superfamily N-acetyltransferase
MNAAESTGNTPYLYSTESTRAHCLTSPWSTLDIPKGKPDDAKGRCSFRREMLLSRTRWYLTDSGTREVFMMRENVVVASGACVVGARDPFARHGEDLVRFRISPELVAHSFAWPPTGVTRENFRETEGIVCRVGGVVAGRAIMDVAFHPLAELENLEVSPTYRGSGVGSTIIEHAVETASRMGFLAMHLQTEPDNVGAQRLYARHGFLPATRGEMLRLWKFLNLPALAQFQHDHPMAVLESKPDSAREHTLRWRDTGSRDELAITIRGGSCQSDSDDVGPSVSCLRLRSGVVRLVAAVEELPSIEVGGTSAVRLSLTNEGSAELSGGLRLGLNQGFRIASDHPGGQRFALRPGEALNLSVPVALDPDFLVTTLDVCPYPSVPVTVDFSIRSHVFWLAGQIRVARAA